MAEDGVLLKCGWQRVGGKWTHYNFKMDPIPKWAALLYNKDAV